MPELWACWWGSDPGREQRGHVQQKAIDAQQRKPGLALIIVALVPFGLGYFFSYLYRAVNAVVAPDLVRDLGLTAAELGLLTSAYLLGFAAFQPMLGILLDRFGPRRVQSALVATGATGALLFAFGRDATTLALARAIIGIGFAGGLMSSFKAVVIWVPEPRRALANSCVMSLGGLGLILSTAPMAWMATELGWRQAFVWLAVVTFAIAALILFVVPERKDVAAPMPAPLSTQLREVAGIYRDPVFLALAPVLAIPAGAHIALQTLWAGPWLRDILGLDRAAVAEHLLIMGIAFLAGILLSGVIADWLTRRHVSLLTVNIGFLIAFLASQVAIIFESAIAPPLLSWSVFVMTGSTAVLAYPWLSSYFGAALSGRSNTAVNLLMFGMAFLVQAAVGWVIDQYPKSSAGGYAPEAYRVAFAVVLGLQVLSLVWYLANSRLLSQAERRMKAERPGAT